LSNKIHQGMELFQLGVRLGHLGTVAIGCAGGELAKALARTVGCGVALAGGEVRFHDGACAACGRWLGEYYGLPATLFVRQKDGKARVYVLDQQGRSLSVDDAVSAGEERPTGQWDLLAGADQAWAANRVAGRRQRGVACAIGPAALTLTLERMGYEVMSHPRPGIPLFRSDREGFHLAVEHNGVVYHPAGVDVLDRAVNFVLQPRAIPAFGPTGSPEWR